MGKSHLRFRREPLASERMKFSLYAGFFMNVCMLKSERRREMPKHPALTRKSFYIDPATLRRAKRALQVRTDAEAIRLSLERVAEMERFWRFMTKSHGVLKPGSFDQS